MSLQPRTAAPGKARRELAVTAMVQRELPHVKKSAI